LAPASGCSAADTARVEDGPIELFTKLFGSLLVFVDHCFDRTL
jgi:hypothetical protein